MISQFFRFVIVNNSGQTLTYASGGRLALKIAGLRRDPITNDWIRTQLTESDCGFSTGTLTDGSETPTDEISNAATRYESLEAQLEVTHDEGTAADGTVDVYFAGGSATGELPSDATGYDSAELNKLDFVGSLTWHGSGADDEVMRSDEWIV